MVLSGQEAFHFENQEELRQTPTLELQDTPMCHTIFEFDGDYKKHDSCRLLFPFIVNTCIQIDSKAAGARNSRSYMIDVHLAFFLQLPQFSRNSVRTQHLGCLLNVKYISNSAQPRYIYSLVQFIFCRFYSNTSVICCCSQRWKHAYGGTCQAWIFAFSSLTNNSYGYICCISYNRRHHWIFRTYLMDPDVFLGGKIP